MRIKATKDKRQKPPKFTGKIKLTIQGLDQHGQLMSGKQGLKARYLVVEDTTVDEAYDVVYEAIRSKEENQ